MTGQDSFNAPVMRAVERSFIAADVAMSFATLIATLH
jgi:hypothetical protein